MNIKKLTLSLGVISLFALSAHAEWKFGGIDFSKPPIQSDFLSKANGGSLENDKALKDGVGVKIFGFGFGKGNFSRTNKILLDCNGTIHSSYLEYFAAGAAGGTAGGAAAGGTAGGGGGGGGTYPITNEIYGGGRGSSTIYCSLAAVGTEGVANDGVTYLVVDNNTIKNHLNRAETLCTSHVTNMSNLFKDNTTFNQPLMAWDTSNVTNMSHMFDNASSFDQTLSTWNVYNVTNMDSMFKNASTFNEYIGDWTLSSPTHVDFATGSGLESDNFPVF